MSNVKAVHLFSNGFEFDNWEAVNCDRCVKQPSCDLFDALFTDSLTNDIPTGSVTTATAERLGWADEYAGVLRWLCKERSSEQEPPAPPTPAAHEVKRAGGLELPGFEDVAAKPEERRYPS